MRPRKGISRRVERFGADALGAIYIKNSAREETALGNYGDVVGEYLLQETHIRAAVLIFFLAWLLKQ